MPPHKQQELEIAQRRQKVAELYLRRRTQAQIASELGVSQATVCGDLQAIQQEWKASAVRDFDLARQIELQKIDLVERTCWESFDRSLKPLQTADITGDGPQGKTKRRIRNQNGDPRFLAQILQCTIHRRALLGLDSPTLITVSEEQLNEEIEREVERIRGGRD